MARGRDGAGAGPSRFAHLCAARGLKGLGVMLFDIPQERPRERMMLFGREELADVELLALILGGGHAITRALTLLQDAGGLLGLDRANPQQLCRTPGVGLAGATAICAALELGRRVAQLQ